MNDQSHVHELEMPGHMKSVGEKSPAAFAFPQSERLGDIARSSGGMTLRQYFAAHAPFTLADARIAYCASTNDYNSPTPDELMDALAIMRWCYADSMLQYQHNGNEVAP